MNVPEHMEESLNFAAAELKELLRPDEDADVSLIQKGLMLYRQGLVRKVIVGNDQVTAIVQDVTPVKVKLNVQMLQTSECACPAEGFCRHQLAVFFQVLASAHSVSDWVQEWRKPLRDKEQTKTWGISKAKELLKASEPGKPDYDSWIAAFDASFQELFFGKGLPKPYVIPDLFEIYLRRLRAAAPIEQEWRLLYELIGYIHAFRQLMSLSEECDFDVDVIERYYRHSFYTLTEETLLITRKLSGQSLPFSFDQFIERLKEEAIALVQTDFSLQYDRTHLYRVLWSEFFTKKEWREAETVKLLEISKEEQPGKLPLVIGLGHLYFLLKDDEKVLEFISIPEPEITPYLHYWLEQINNHKDWSRIGPYIDAFIANIGKYLEGYDNNYAAIDYTSWALRTIYPYCTETNRFDVYEKALTETLPYSYSEYESLLIEGRLYDKWVDLQALLAFDLDMLESHRVKEIEKADPELLLPLYHQAVQLHIDRKNRDEYRRAVRKIKKLRTIYSKLKRKEEWNFFLKELLERTKRLRAFQEECKRGKLIDA